MATPQQQQPQTQWQDILEASIRMITMMAPTTTVANNILDALIYELLDRYGFTKADIRPILEQYDLEFPEQVVCEACNQYDEDKELDTEQQPHVYYEECPYCEKYFHNETLAHKTNLPCKGHQYKCQQQENSDC